VVAGCGSSDNSHNQQEVLPGPTLGSIRTVDCADWRKGSVVQRNNTVIALHGFAGGQVGSSEQMRRGPVLNDGQAYRLFQSYCSKYFARGFKLYKLYERAAGFAGHQPGIG
jgi:hypothetical protein